MSSESEPQTERDEDIHVLTRARDAQVALDSAADMLEEDEIADIDQFVNEAREDLAAAIQGVDTTYVVTDDTTTDEEDVFGEELHDVAHGMVTTAFIFDSDERGLTGFKVPTSEIEWVDFKEAKQ